MCQTDGTTPVDLRVVTASLYGIQIRVSQRLPVRIVRNLTIDSVRPVVPVDLGLHHAIRLGDRMLVVSRELFEALKARGDALQIVRDCPCT